MNCPGSAHAETPPRTRFGVIQNPKPGAHPLTATAVCVRPDGARQTATTTVLGNLGELLMPIDVLKPGAYRELINDSKAAFECLFNRPEIDRKKIALAGHSEGAETALTMNTSQAVVAVTLHRTRVRLKKGLRAFRKGAS